MLIVGIDKQLGGSTTKCSKTQCTRPAIGNGIKYCSHLRMKFKTDVFPLDSTYIRYNYYSLRFGKTITCTAHNCQELTCGNCQFDLSRSCVSHKCHFDGCLRKRYADHRVYCDLRKCAIGSHCLNLKESNRGRIFCLSHNCAISGCLTSRMKEANLYEDHGRYSFFPTPIPLPPKRTNQQSTTSTPKCPVIGNPAEKDAAKEPKNSEPFSAINIYAAKKDAPSKCSTTIHSGVKNTPPAPSNPAPPHATTPPLPASLTNVFSQSVPPRNSSPPNTAAGINATWTTVYGCARARIDFAICTSV
ncbi:uncharacterized protein EAF01_006226 [Botrytis porri]|uniref:uncharacterized protein n=1 Tax=Botrytis porri TaxID=87229 RepID=UPI0019008358|nr:uncharacterized protein EAF01_006226 [Botrytis porri]KAF7903177.1 hypothetical protein EAF01_006226 [Botrytis porri]